MPRFAAVALLVLIGALFVSASGRCAERCFQSSVQWPDGSETEYSFSLLPCDPVQPLIAAQLGDAAEEPAFACVAQEGGVALSLSADDVHLEWRYRTDMICEELLLAIDTIPGEFVGTRHAHGERVQEQGEALNDAQLQCAEPVCEPQCFSLPAVLADGLAGEKSPCGTAGVEECQMRVVAAVNPCDGGVVEKFDVLIGADEVPLHIYRPAALEGAQLLCVDGALQLASDGVMVTFAPSGRAADCETMITRLSTLATGDISVVMVSLGGEEQWAVSDDGDAQLQGSSLAASAVDCVRIAPAQTNDLGENGGLSDDGTVHIAVVPAVPHPITPTINCSTHLPDDYCCTVFGYHNPNAMGLSLDAGKPNNFFIPPPVDQGQVTSILANITVQEAFSVIWHCPEYERQKLRWVLNVPAAGEDRTTWRRSVDAWRERQDCTEDQKDTWCLVA